MKLLFIAASSPCSASLTDMSSKNGCQPSKVRNLASLKVLLGLATFLINPLLVVNSSLDQLPPATISKGHVHVLPRERASPPKELVNLEYVRGRDQARHARMMQGVEFSVNGSSDPFRGGLYFTKVKLGSPPREFNVQIDTGSDVLWITCSSCTNCPKTSELGIGLNFFDTASSSTANAISCSDPICTSKIPNSAAVCLEQTSQCGYTFQYGDGSGTSGYYVSDDLYFDMILDQSLTANSSAPITFGCSIYQSGDLVNTDKAVDGIFGFGQGRMSVISQLSARAIIPKVFSHCLRGNAEGGGTMVIGEIAEPNIVYSPLVPSQPHYNLNMQSIAVNGQVLPIDPTVFATSNTRGTIVDSGTTLAYLVEEAFDPFISAVNAAISDSVTPTIVKGTQCYLSSTSVSESFPTASLNFAGGASMLLTPDEYLVRVSSVEGTALWCIGFVKTQQGVSILGDLVLKDKIIVYDLARQKIGWANRNCSVSINMSATYGADKFIYDTDINSSNLAKKTLFNLLLALLSPLLVFLLQ